MVDTTDEWIVTRTGIRERRIWGSRAGEFLHGGMGRARVPGKGRGRPQEVDVIIVGTVTPDMFFPSTACLVQNEIGAKNAWGFDLLAGCSGFLFTLATAARMIEAGGASKVLAIGSDVISTVIDYEDRDTCVLFGDGAGAALLEACNEPDTVFSILFCTSTAPEGIICA